MAKERGPNLTEATIRGLSFMHSYRMASIPQFAWISGLSYKHAAEVLLDLERRGLLGYLGFTSIPGQGKTPKVYYLKRRGFTPIALSSFPRSQKQISGRGFEADVQPPKAADAW